jgi:hypothetical protein
MVDCPNLKVKLLNANQKLESKEKELSGTRNTLYQIVKDTKRRVKREIINEKDISKAVEILDKYSITPYFSIAKTMKYDKYEDRFELGDIVMYDGKT